MLNSIDKITNIYIVVFITLCYVLQHEMKINALKEEKMVVEERAAQYLSDLSSFKSQNADVESALKELQNKLGYCENEKVLFCCCCFC